MSVSKGSNVTVSSKKAFEIFDIDKSGFISADEIVAILTTDTPAGKPLKLEDATEIVKDFDHGGTGELNVSPCQRAMYSTRTRAVHAALLTRQ
jgi:Ca2+-binding EF-hand superfamily protein